MGKRKDAVLVEAARRAKELRDHEPRNTRADPRGYSLAYVRRVLRYEGFGDFTEDQIDQAVRALEPPSPPDLQAKGQKFREEFRADNPRAMVVPDENEWHRRMREMFARPRARAREGTSQR